METLLFENLEKHTLMLLDSQNILMKLKSSGALGKLTLLFRDIFKNEQDFASGELKRISKELNCEIDFAAELQNNKRIFQINLKQIVSQIIEFVWQKGPCLRSQSLKEKPAKQIKAENIFKNSEHELESKQHFQDLLSSKKHNLSKKEDVPQKILSDPPQSSGPINKTFSQNQTFEMTNELLSRDIRMDSRGFNSSGFNCMEDRISSQFEGLISKDELEVPKVRDTIHLHNKNYLSQSKSEFLNILRIIYG